MQMMQIQSKCNAENFTTAEICEYLWKFELNFMSIVCSIIGSA